jgi:hypothetical protein
MMKLGDSANDECYRLLSVDAVRAPEGCAGNDWHRYRITQGDNGIAGYRRGNLATVTQDVEAIVAALNERRQASRGKAASKRQRQPAASVQDVDGK